MALDSDDLSHLLVEVVLGVPPEQSTLPDTDEVREKRAVYEQEVADIRARGLQVEIPREFPQAEAQAMVEAEEA
jgi:hypothetical protein